MTTCHATTRRHDVQLRADGQINLAAYVTHSLQLHPGDVIDIAYERTDATSEYYLYVARRGRATTGRHLGACHRVNESGDGFLRAHNIALCRFMLHECGQQQVVRLRAGAMCHHPELGICMTLVLGTGGRRR